MAFVRMLGRCSKDATPAPHRAHRGRRGAHLRHGQPVQSRWASTAAWASATRPRTRSVAELPRGAGRADPGRGHQRPGAIASWTAAATSQRARPGHAAVLHLLLMFGFQRVGDAIWAAADQRRAAFAGRHLGPHHAGRRGPAAPGRHQPSGGAHHPQLQGAYDPAYAGEMAVIVTRACARW